MPAQKNRNRLSQPQGNAVSRSTVHYLDGTSLARHLMDPERSQTAVVVSHVPRESHRLDARLLAQRLGDGVRVYEIENGLQTHRLEDGLPPGLQIFGVGARVYPHGHEWELRVPGPHVARHMWQLGKIMDSVEQEVLAARNFSAPQVVTAPVPVVVQARVIGFPAEDRALVELPASGKQALIRSGDLLPGVPVEWLVRRGQQLSGVLDPVEQVVDVRGLLLPLPSPIRLYGHGEVALARVKSVSPAQAVVELWPGHEARIDIGRISSNELDSAQDLLTEGEVVRVRVLYASGAVRLSMLDVDDDETAVPAPALLRGGPPWLDSDRPYAGLPASGAPPEPPRSSPREDADDVAAGAAGVEHSEVQEPAPNPSKRRVALQSTQMQLEAARHTIAELMAGQKRRGATDKLARALQDQLAQERERSLALVREANEASHQIAALKEELAKTKASLVKLRQKMRSANSQTDGLQETLFNHPDEQFNFELLHMWARVVPASDKAEQPLGSYVASQHFLDSWTRLTGQQRNKALRAVVDLVADRQGPLRKREPHILRQNEGAHAAPTMRGNDVCMRLYVEQGTAGALRLHYWKLDAGGVELHEVVRHDVVKP